MRPTVVPSRPGSTTPPITPVTGLCRRRTTHSYLWIPPPKLNRNRPIPPVRPSSFPPMPLNVQSPRY